jgi:hypothetical protein
MIFTLELTDIGFQASTPSAAWGLCCLYFIGCTYVAGKLGVTARDALKHRSFYGELVKRLDQLRADNASGVDLRRRARAKLGLLHLSRQREGVGHVNDDFAYPVRKRRGDLRAATRPSTAF